MKEFTGEKLTRAAKAVSALKNTLYDIKEYRKFINGKTLVKFIVDDANYKLVYEGSVDNAKYTMTVVEDKCYRVHTYIAEFDDGRRIECPADQHCTDIDYEWFELSNSSYEDVLLWINSVTKDFKGVPVRIADWKQHNQDTYDEFTRYCRKYDTFNTELFDPEKCAVKFYRFTPTIMHFTHHSYDDITFSIRAGLQDGRVPFMLIRPYYIPDSGDDQFFDKIIMNGEKLTEIRNKFGKIVYSIQEADDFVEGVRKRVEAYLDSMAEKHNIKWRGIEITESGPVGEPTNKPEYERKALNVVLDYIADATFDFRKIFTEDERTKVNLGSINYGAEYSKTITVMKKKGKKLIPHTVSLSMVATTGFRNLEQVVMYNERPDAYDTDVQITFPFMYRTINGKYMTFDSALENSDGGPVDIHWRPTTFWYKSLESNYDVEFPRDIELETQMLRLAFSDNKAEFEKFKTEHYDYFHRAELHFTKIFKSISEQYEKYLKYAGLV